jgi:hypothetical protein
MACAEVSQAPSCDTSVRGDGHVEGVARLQGRQGRRGRRAREFIDNLVVVRGRAAACASVSEAAGAGVSGIVSSSASRSTSLFIATEGPATGGARGTEQRRARGAVPGSPDLARAPMRGSWPDTSSVLPAAELNTPAPTRHTPGGTSVPATPAQEALGS